jgi:hypothetical protein
VLRVMITDKLGGESVAQQEPMLGIEHRRHKGSAIGRKSAPVGMMASTGQIKCFTSARQTQHFPPARDPTNCLFHSAVIAADDAAVVNNGEPAGAHVSRRYGQRLDPSTRAAESPAMPAPARGSHPLQPFRSVHGISGDRRYSA